MLSLPPSLSRTSSSASFSSSDDISPGAINASRRTRKRFTNTQLTMLENLFHQTSHPSREEREAVAKAGQMEIKSVTIWFQNKRQTERKSAANKDGSSRTDSPTLSSTTPSSTKSPLVPRPTLDRIATRTEMRNNQAPRTPRRHGAPPAVGGAPIWDHMPSSPLVPASPAAPEYIDYGKSVRSKRTLEWACAAARVSDKDPSYSQQKPGHSHGHSHHSHAHSYPSYPYASTGRSSSSTHPSGPRVVHREKPQVNYHPDATPKGAPMDLDSTDDEEDEAITPPSTWDTDDGRWTFRTVNGAKKPLPTGVDDDDMMKAALALCGLGGRRIL